MVKPSQGIIANSGPGRLQLGFARDFPSAEARMLMAFCPEIKRLRWGRDAKLFKRLQIGKEVANIPDLTSRFTSASVRMCSSAFSAGPKSTL